MDATSCVREYKSLSREIFREREIIPGKKLWDAYWGNPWFSSEGHEKAVQGLIADRLSPAERDQLEADTTDAYDAALKKSDLQAKT
jgi:hypothetical protein